MASTTTLNRSFAEASTTSVQDTVALVGRVLIAYLFIPAGWGKLVGFSGVAGYIASKGVPMPEVCAAISIAFELGLGLLLLFGYQARRAALGLAVFVAVITPIIHNYWTMAAAQQMMNKQAFDKNLAIIGGLLVLAVFGAGGYSLDGRRKG